MDDLSSWLRAAAENKITTKNTWKSTLIEHFADLSKFQDQKGVNFQKASTALDGCIKVYATRVDDVATNTAKLLGAFGQEKATKKKTKRFTTFIEKDVSNINIKERNTLRFNDQLFADILNETNFMFLIDVLPVKNSGLFLYENIADEDNEIIINKRKEEIEMEIYLVSPSLRKIKEGNIIVDEAINGNITDNINENINESCWHEPELDLECDEQEEYSEEEVEIAKEPEIPDIIEETPFGYFKGWGGPDLWNIRAGKKTKKQEIKKKEMSFIDFTKEVENPTLFERYDTTMTKESIMERRRTRNILPEDLHVGCDDLFRFMKLDGHFGKARGQSNVVLGQPNTDFEYSGTKAESNVNQNVGLENTSIQPDNSFIVEEADQERVVSIEKMNTKLKQVRNYTSVDIKELKSKIMKSINEDVKNIREIYRNVRNTYDDKEVKGITMHQCLVSLLYIANENGYELVPRDGNISVCVANQNCWIG